jgi:hypothetical protein
MVVDQVEEILAHLFGAQPLGRLVAVAGEALDGAHIGFLRAGGEVA